MIKKNPLKFSKPYSPKTRYIKFYLKILKFILITLILFGIILWFFYSKSKEQPLHSQAHPWQAIKNLFSSKHNTTNTTYSTFLNYSHHSSVPCKQQLKSETCEKIGQMLIVGFGGLYQDENGQILWEDPDGMNFKENSMIARQIKNQHIGGVILFNKPYFQNKTGKFIRFRNVVSPEQLSNLNQQLKNYSAQSRRAENLPALELIVSIDQEGGMVNRLPETQGFTQSTMIPQAFGANQEFAQQPNLPASLQKNQPDRNLRIQTAQNQTLTYANAMADMLRNLNFNVNLAPVVDLNLNPLNYVLGGRGRSFSANPLIVTEQAKQFIQAFHQSQLIAALKHFPGHGSSRDDTHEGLVNVTETYEKNLELEPYRRLIQAGYQDFIMTAHVINGQIDKTQCKAGDPTDPKTWCPATMSYATLTTLLRNTLGFKGVIISDDMSMGAIAKEYPLDIALEKAIHAGVDMFIVSNNYSTETEHMINTIAQLVKEGRVQEDEINRAYQNILALKARLQ